MFFVYCALKITELYSSTVYFYMKEKEGWHVYDRLHKTLTETLDNYLYIFGFVLVFLKRWGLCEKVKSRIM